MARSDQAKPLAPLSGYYPRSDEVDEAISAEFDLHRRYCCLRCCGCAAAVLLILLVTILVLFFTVLHIKDPVLTADRVAFHQLLRSTSLGVSNFTVEITVSVRNPNAAAFHYENMTTRLYYGGDVVGEGEVVPPGKVGARGRKQLNVTVEVEGGKVAGAEPFAGDWRSGNLSFHSETRVPGRVKLTDAIKKKLVARLDCDLTYVVDTQQVIKN
ncbi:hypothetical protein MLD38_038626 [Melastoma candidum]|uniref:Uncharacterized protein n=1 Tax=Melastoma candidum TaxID=119954 RepID=A0ACB9L1T8_9MYRT|nr:hypothetical protein MLD38_038626 [Melastoma candidum]